LNVQAKLKPVTPAGLLSGATAYGLSKSSWALNHHAEVLDEMAVNLGRDFADGLVNENFRQPLRGTRTPGRHTDWRRRHSHRKEISSVHGSATSGEPVYDPGFAGTSPLAASLCDLPSLMKELTPPPGLRQSQL